MSDYNAMRSLIKLIETGDTITVMQLYDNITKEASDHVKYPAIVQAYKNRMQNENI